LRKTYCCPPSGRVQQLIDAIAIAIESDDRLAINYERTRRVAVSLIHQFVECSLGCLDIPGFELNAFLPKKLFGCSAVGSAGLMEQNHFFHNATP
jgi:hypothetical protein